MKVHKAILMASVLMSLSCGEMACGGEDSNDRKAAPAQETEGATPQPVRTPKSRGYVIESGGQKFTVAPKDVSSALKRSLDRYPADLPARTLRPSHAVIKELARSLGLLDETQMNPHLSFLGGDIAYWTEQGLSLNRLEAEFAARKAVLQAADRDGVAIDDQGKLSFAAQPIVRDILRKNAAARRSPKAR